MCRNLKNVRMGDNDLIGKRLMVEISSFKIVESLNHALKDCRNDK
jgi:hypothetical protein